MSFVKDKLQTNKKLLLLFLATAAFALYILYPTENSSPDRESQRELDKQLSELKQERSKAKPREQQKSFDGTDRRGVSLGTSGGGNHTDPGAFMVEPPLLEGILVGYGTKTVSGREYWVAFVEVEDQAVVGYEVDLRNIIGYQREQPDRWVVGDFVRIFGDLEKDNIIRARIMQ